MLCSRKQLSATVGRRVFCVQKSRSPVSSAISGALPPLVRAQLAAENISGSCGDMLWSAKPYSILVRATTAHTDGPAKRVCRGVGGMKDVGGMDTVLFQGDLRFGSLARLLLLHASLVAASLVCTLARIRTMRATSTGPFSGPFGGPESKPKTGVPSVGSTDDDNSSNDVLKKGKKEIPFKPPPKLQNRFMRPPEDGLTRYPTLRSPQGVLRGLDYLGTAVFALSGTVTAGTAGMDLLGCVIVGTITATGGGTVRDLLLGNNPVFWMHETEYLWMCLFTTISVFFVWSYLAERGVRDDNELLNWADAMGIGAFCCIGAQAGVRKGLSKIVCVCCGMLTSSFGGVIRDVLCSRPPRILFSHAEIYASTALLGSTVYIASKAAGFSPVGRITAGFLAAAGLRVLAFKTDIRLPSWTQQSDGLATKLKEQKEQANE